MQATVNFFYAADLVDIVLKNIGDAIDDIIEGFRNNRSNVTTDTDKYDAVIVEESRKEHIRLKDNFQRTRILLGPVEVIKPTSTQSKIINIGDIPISFKHFLEWITTKLLDKNIEVFTLPTFFMLLIWLT